MVSSLLDPPPELDRLLDLIGDIEHRSELGYGLLLEDIDGDACAEKPQQEIIEVQWSPPSAVH